MITTLDRKLLTASIGRVQAYIRQWVCPQRLLFTLQKLDSFLEIRFPLLVSGLAFIFPEVQKEKVLSIVSPNLFFLASGILIFYVAAVLLLALISAYTLPIFSPGYPIG